MTFSPFSSQYSPVCIFAARTGHPDRGPSRQTTTDRQLVCVPAKSQMSFASVFAHRVLLLLRDWCCVCVCFMLVLCRACWVTVPSVVLVKLLLGTLRYTVLDMILLTRDVRPRRARRAPARPRISTYNL